MVKSVRMSGEILSVNGRMLATVSNKGWDVYHCLAAPAAAPGSLSHWLLWSISASTDPIIRILNHEHQTCLLLSESVNSSHYPLNWALQEHNTMKDGT